MGVLHSAENHPVVHAHSSTPQVEAVPLGPVIALVEVEVVVVDEDMAVAATFEIEIETATETLETATSEIHAMDPRSGAMSIANMEVAETVSSIPETIALVLVEVDPGHPHATFVI
jgi:hypothetical protein